jgi:hypothetical protein
VGDIVEIGSRVQRQRGHRSRRLKPWTRAHLREYGARLVFDDGEQHGIEEWFLDFAVDLADGSVFGSGERATEGWLIVPEGNGKTTSFGFLAIYGAEYCSAPWIPIGASNRDQAKIMYRQAQTFIEKTPGLARRFECLDGYKQIKSLRNGGEGIVVRPWSPASNDGAIPFPYALVDEPHRHPTMGLYHVWKGKVRKRGGQVALISTAGEPGSEFENLRDKMRAKLEKRAYRGARLRGRGRGVVFHEYMVRDVNQVGNMRAVKAANPMTLITEEELATDYGGASFDLGHWKRVKCCVPSRSAFAAITETEWENATDEEYVERDDVVMALPEGERIDAGLDIAWKIDTTCFVPCLPAPGRDVLCGPLQAVDGKLRRGAIVPPRDGSSLHPDTILEVIELTHARNPIMHLVMDIHEARDVAARVEDMGITVVEWSQENDQKCIDYERMMEGLRTKKTTHTGDPTLRSHAMNAVALRRSANRRRFDRPSQSRAVALQDQRVIDGLDAGAMVNAFRNEEPEAQAVPMVGVV